MRYMAVLVITGLFYACGSSLDQSHQKLVGSWDATWQMDPTAFPDSLNSKSFTMNGKWVFEDDLKMSITTYGFKGCIFGEDTLAHTQNWRVSNDTIFLMNDKKIASLVCKVLSESDSEIKVQIYKDIFVSLAKAE